MSAYLDVWPLGEASTQRQPRPGGGMCMARIRLLGDWHAASRSGGTAHHAQDIFAPPGTPVKAPISGRVEFAGQTPNGGNNVRIRKGNVTVQLSHFRDAPRVHAGDTVRAGDVVGVVGNTGARASRTCSHLHIGVRDRGRAVNIYPELVALMPPRGLERPRDAPRPERLPEWLRVDAMDPTTGPKFMLLAIGLGAYAYASRKRKAT